MAGRSDDSADRPEAGDRLRSDDADAVVDSERGNHDPGDGLTRNPRTGETPSERRTRQISELLQETRVAAVGVQVIIGFLLAIPFNATLDGLQRDAYLVALFAAVLATGLLLAPSVIHRSVLHLGQAAWIVAVGSRLLLLGMAATAVALVAVSLLVGDRLLEGAWRFLPPLWATLVLGGLWGALPGLRRWRLTRHDDDRAPR